MCMTQRFPYEMRVPEYLIADIDPARFRGAGDAQDDRILGLSAVR